MESGMEAHQRMVADKISVGELACTQACPTTPCMLSWTDLCAGHCGGQVVVHCHIHIYSISHS